MQETTAGDLHDIAFMDPLRSAMNSSPTFVIIDACVESPQFRARDQISGVRHIVRRVLRPALHRRSMQDISSCTLMLRRKGVKTGDGSCGSIKVADNPLAEPSGTVGCYSESRLYSYPGVGRHSQEWASTGKAKILRHIVAETNAIIPPALMKPG